MRTTSQPNPPYCAGRDWLVPTVGDPYSLLTFGKSATGGGPPPWSPADLPSLLPTVQVALSRSQGKLWQDAGKTVPATANADPVRVATCPFTGDDWTSPSDAARLLLKTDGTFWWLESDGSTLELDAPSTCDLTGASSLSLGAAQTADGGAGSRIVQSQNVNCVLTFRRSSFCVYCQPGLIHNATLFADGNSHTAQLSKSLGGDWALWADGVAQTVTANANDWFHPCVGFGSFAEGFTGRVYAVVPTAADLSGPDQSQLATYLQSLMP